SVNGDRDSFATGTYRSIGGLELYAEEIFTTSIPEYDGSAQFSIIDEVDDNFELELNRPLNVFSDGEVYQMEIIAADAKKQQVILRVDDSTRTASENDEIEIGGIRLDIENMFISNIPVLDAQVEVVVQQSHGVLVDNLLIAVSDVSPADDVQLASDITTALMHEGYDLPSGATRLFSELPVSMLDDYVTIAIYDGDVVIVLGEHVENEPDADELEDAVEKVEDFLDEQYDIDVIYMDDDEVSGDSLQSVFDADVVACNVADLNADGVVDGADITIWDAYNNIKEYLPADFCGYPDVDRDNDVDTQDLAIIQDNMGIETGDCAQEDLESFCGQDSCIDTDLGASIHQRGYTMDVGEFAPSQDFCSGDDLHEFVCEYDDETGVYYREEEIITCEYGCHSGVCAPAQSQPETPVVLTAFVDFECPFSAQWFLNVYPELRETYDDSQVTFDINNFPLPFHANAEEAALNAVCADYLDLPDAFYAYLFQNQYRLNESAVYDEALAFAGVTDTDDFEDCMSSSLAEDKLDIEMEEAEERNVVGTPTVFVNGQKFSGLPTLQEMKAAIDTRLTVLSCSDSDAMDYFTKGTTTEWETGAHSGSGSEVTDSCLDSETVREFYCDENGRQSVDYTCPTGCSNGACITDDDLITREMSLQEGWNLVPIGHGIEFWGEGFAESMIGAYVWDADTQMYHDLFADEDVVEDIIVERGYTAVWVYLNDDVEISLTLDLQEIQETIEDLDFQFEEGWNFYVILPQMQYDLSQGFFSIGMDQEKHAGYIRGNRVYAWERDEWELGDYESDILNNDQLDEIAGMPFIAYYEEQFSPFYMQMDIPEFPE
ncbi:MAG: thioredoxin domain-containing protein, partial [Nanoarchaeota archaeon]